MAFAIDKASTIKRAVIIEMHPIIIIKIDAKAYPPIKNTDGIIRGPVPNITFKTVNEVTRGV